MRSECKRNEYNTPSLRQYAITLINNSLSNGKSQWFQVRKSLVLDQNCNQRQEKNDYVDDKVSTITIINSKQVWICAYAIQNNIMENHVPMITLESSMLTVYDQLNVFILFQSTKCPAQHALTFLTNKKESLSLVNCSTVQFKNNGLLQLYSNRKINIEHSDNDLYKIGGKIWDFIC